MAGKRQLNLRLSLSRYRSLGVLTGPPQDGREQGAKMEKVEVKLGQVTSVDGLILLMGDAVLGLIVSGGGISDLYVIVDRVADGLRLVSLEAKEAPAKKVLDLQGSDADHQPIHIVMNPEDVIKMYQSRYYLICKSYGLRH